MHPTRRKNGKYFLCTGDPHYVPYNLHIAVDFLKSLKIAVVWGGGVATGI
jgi:hypothetical protein